MKISIITVCKNASDELAKTIKSVKEQNFVDFEYIVVDGESTDNTEEIVSKNKRVIDKYISEKDGGIYEAMNKGVGMASGDYVYFLNAGDTFFGADSLGAVIDNVVDEDVVYGNVEEVDGGIHHLNRFDRVGQWFLVNNTICHQAMFIKRSMFARFGDYDTKFKIAADYEWLLRVWNKNISIKYIDVTIAKFMMDGVSSDRKYRNRTLREYQAIRKQYFNLWWRMSFWFYEIMVSIYQKYLK